MTKTFQIGRWEAFCLVVNAICAKIFLSYPRTSAEIAGTASWLLSVYISVIALIGFTVIMKLYSKFEGMDLLDIGEKMGGRIGKIITGLIVISFILFIIPIVLREFTEDMKIISLPISPISFVTSLFIAGMIISAYFGLEAIARASGIIIFIVTLAYLIILLGIFPYYNINNLFPILGNGATAVFGTGTLKVSCFSELLYLFMIIPFLKSAKEVKPLGYIIIGFSGLMFFLGSLVFILAFPYPSSTESFLPIYEMARLINFGGFFQRAESIFLISWAASAYMYISSGFYILIYTFKKTFDLEYEKPLIIPFAIIIYILSLLPQNLIDAQNLEVNLFRNWSWLITFIFTIIILLIARFVGKKPETT